MANTPSPKKLDDHPVIRRLNSVRSAAAKQKNRAKVLVYASAIEGDLNELFAKYFVGTKGISNDRLLNSRRPGSLDLAVKIELAYRLGLISNRLKSHLNMIRDFRNDCAHLEADFDFASQEVRSRISSAYLEYSDDARKTFSHESGDYEGMFMTICTLSISIIQGVMTVSDKTTEHKLETFYKGGEEG
jgi:DNA-binding MltR family transcriptional regulator